MRLLILGLVLFISGLGFSYLTVSSAIPIERKLNKQDVVEVYNKLNKYTGLPGLMPDLLVENNPIINAWISPEGLTITTGMLNFMKDKDELAAVIGHEMGHYMLQHFDLPGDNRVHEANADKYGIFLVLRAGYNVCAGKGLWERMGDAEGDTILTISHPSPAQRVWELDFPMCH